MAERRMSGARRVGPLRWVGPLCAALITMCVFAALYLDAPAAGIIGWSGALVVAAVWMVVELRRSRARNPLEPNRPGG